MVGIRILRYCLKYTKEKRVNMIVNHELVKRLLSKETIGGKTLVNLKK